MKEVSINNDIIPITDFKSGISKDYDDLVYRKSFLDSVSRGIADADSGRTSSTKSLRAKMSSKRNGI